MDLSSLYHQVQKMLDTLDFDAFWPGFSRCPFALYDSERVILGDESFPRTDEFIANTAIRYKDEWIAVWKLTKDIELVVLTGKIVHEMFHVHQMEQRESRFPNEMEALTQYEYSPAYLTVKHWETVLLADLYERFDAIKYNEFLSLRKRRMTDYPFQYRYECGVEAIEGSAQYVEWQALKTLQIGLYREAKADCVSRMEEMNNLMPVRTLCYDTGAALLDVCISNRLPINLRVGECSSGLLPNSVLQNAVTAVMPEPGQAIQTFYHAMLEAFSAKIITITQSGHPIAQGSFELLGVNVYSARYLNGYIYTEYFLQYNDRKPVTLFGNYLLKMESGRIAEIYRDIGEN